MRIVKDFSDKLIAPDEFRTICDCGNFLIVDRVLDKLVDDDSEFFRCCECGSEFIIN